MRLLGAEPQLAALGAIVVDRAARLDDQFMDLAALRRNHDGVARLVGVDDSQGVRGCDGCRKCKRGRNENMSPHGSSPKISVDDGLRQAPGGGKRAYLSHN